MNNGNGLLRRWITFVLLWWYTPVSYTHLDVYKRQEATGARLEATLCEIEGWFSYGKKSTVNTDLESIHPQISDSGQSSNNDGILKTMHML